ncbi:GNAT family N-acetyltransferase [Bradyrhizobium sp. LjRoot220]|uniref:GNAT family N-acetyltransferase n=1 Tax=Bradyrhizobium sp. LjRoot220 TaxID=3342284 RepID=UPI003ECF8C46
MNDLRIRPMRPDEISIAVDWAAAEGWNPGFADDACFATVDPEGFLIGEVDGAPAATVSCVNYGASFAFLGFYIVRADLRGRGYGLRIWNAAIAHAGARVIGLDGVAAQQQNYRRSGFELAYANIRYGGTVAAPAAPQARAFSSEVDTGSRQENASNQKPTIVALTEIPLAAVEAYDASVFPAPRTAFLRCWIGSPGHRGRALVRDGSLAGWGVIRPCRNGHKIGPLVADDRAAAEAVLSTLLASVGGGEIFLDVPAINRDAVALAQDLGLAPVFETARMYTGAIPPMLLQRVFGITTFELG